MHKHSKGSNVEVVDSPGPDGLQPDPPVSRACNLRHGAGSPVPGARSAEHGARMSKQTSMLSVVALLAATLAMGGCDFEGRDYRSLGTAGTGGLYYPLGGTIASRLSALDEHNRSFTAEVTGGAVQNVRLLQRGDMDLAMSLSITAHRAYNGLSEGEEAFEDLRIVAPLYPNVVNVLVPGNSNAETLADLEGLRVSVGAAGSGTEQVSRVLLDVYGLSYDTVRERYLTFGETSAAIRDGSIEGGIISVGYPAAAVMEVMETGEGRLLPIDSPWSDELAEAHPYYFRSIIPEGAYRGVTEDIPTIAEWNWILARESLDDDIVENVLHIVSEERDRLIQVTSIAEQIDLAALHDAPIPLHPATERWLQENLPQPAEDEGAVELDADADVDGEEENGDG